MTSVDKSFNMGKIYKIGFALVTLCTICAGVWRTAGTIAARQDNLLAERAYQDREILYELQDPQSHAFRITHDYTERKEGAMHYFNVVRAGSRVSDPESIDLDTGENLKWETLSGKQVKERKLPLTDVIDDAEVVVTYLAGPIAKGSPTRFRPKQT